MNLSEVKKILKMVGAPNNKMLEDENMSLDSICYFTGGDSREVTMLTLVNSNHSTVTHDCSIDTFYRIREDQGGVILRFKHECEFNKYRYVVFCFHKGTTYTQVINCD